MESKSSAIALTTDQLKSIFNQMGLFHVQFAPTAHVQIEVSPGQLNRLISGQTGRLVLPSGLIRLGVPELTDVFNQLGLYGAQFASTAQAYLQLNSQQISQFLPDRAHVPVVKLPEVYTVPETRIDRRFVGKLADKMGITVRDMIDVLQGPNTDNIGELTKRLNEIFSDLNPPLTQQEVQEMVLLTLPANW